MNDDGLQHEAMHHVQFLFNGLSKFVLRISWMVDILPSETSPDLDWNIGLSAAVREVTLRNVECRLPGASHMGDPCHGGSLNQQASPGQKYTPKSENIKDARGNIQEHSDPECFKITMWAGFELSEPCHHFWFPSLHSQASPVKSMQDSLVFPQPKYHWFLGPGYYRNPQGIIGSKLEIHWAWWYWWYNVTQNLVLSAEIGKWRSSHKASSRFKLLNPSCPRKPATVERSKSIGLPCVVPIAKHVFLLWEFETGLPISDAVNAWLRATIPWRSRSW